MNNKLKHNDATSICAINLFKVVLPNTMVSYSFSVLYFMVARMIAYSVMAIMIGMNMPTYQTSM